MSHMFLSAKAFNQNIGGWHVSKVTNMTYMFHNAASVKALSAIVMATLECFPPKSGVTIMVYCVSLNLVNEPKLIEPYIGNWDVSKVTNMSHMFLSAKAFNQNIGGWHVSKVTNMTYMFHNATSFNQNIGSWDVGKVTDVSYMFSSADAFNQNIGNWNVSNVTTMDSMFWAATAFNQDIGNWDISSLTNAIHMFKDTSMTLNNMDSTFRHLTNIPVTNVLVKGCCTKKHMTHISHLTNIPTANVLIKGGCIKKCFLCITRMRHIPMG
jgi:surface protein